MGQSRNTHVDFLVDLTGFTSKYIIKKIINKININVEFNCFWNKFCIYSNMSTSQTLNVGNTIAITRTKCISPLCAFTSFPQEVRIFHSLEQIDL